MEILKVSDAAMENDKMLMYKLSRAPGVNIQNCVGDVIDVGLWALYKDGDGDRSREILAIISGDKIFRSVSPTFKRSFLDIVENFAVTPQITVVAGQSKQGRTYVDCVMVALNY